MSQTVSLVTIVHNEGKNLAELIPNVLPYVDQILVVDDGSDDGSPELAAKLGACVIRNKWQGFGAQWNRGITEAGSEWILIADSDQRIDPALGDFLKKLRTSENVDADGYLVHRNNIFLGKWMRHGGFYPDLPFPRLFRKGLAQFDESALVHERLVYTGRPPRMAEGAFLHYSYSSYEQYIAKINNYTSLEAKQRLNSRRGLGSYCLRALWAFFDRYIVKLGFMDGPEGFIFAMLSGFYKFLIGIKLRQYRREQGTKF